MRYVLFNPLSTTCLKEDKLVEAMNKIDASKELKLVDVTTIEDAKSFLSQLGKDDDIVLAGGDGTLNKFVNKYDFKNFDKNIYLYKAGNGNDFIRDINEFKEDFVLLNPYLNNLPTVKVNDIECKYVNGIGFGIDGLVCVESDKMKAEGKKDINYTTLSIKLLLTKFKKVKAKVVVDGKEYNFKNVFLASAMNGKYYGGGMKVAPSQDRMSDSVTVCVWHDLNRINGLMLFPSIFKGEHVKKEKKVTILTGKHVSVTFDKPTALQIDGESIDKVTHYEVNK